jgi:hypothetical protein
MKKNLNKNVIKAISIGLSATMMMQPIAALADELDENVTPVTEELPGEEVAEDETAEEENIMDQISDAKDALDEAEAKEGKVAKEALVIIGSGIVTDETLAIIADTKAENHVENGKQDIIEGEQNVADQLSDYYENKDSVDAESADLDNVVDRAVALFDNASFYAEAGKSENWQSGTANMYADQALPSVEALESLAATAGKDAKEAADAYAELKAQYEEAVRLANEATEAANEEFAKGGANADWAVKEARDAVAKANALRIATWTTAQAAGWNLSLAQFIYDGAKDNLEEATKNLVAATGDVIDEAGDVMVAKAALDTVGELLDAAYDLKDLAEDNVEAKEAVITNLETKKAAADTRMTELSQQIATLEREISDYENQVGYDYYVWFQKKHYLGTLEKALNDAKGAYNEAKNLLETYQRQQPGLDRKEGQAEAAFNTSGSKELRELEVELRGAKTDEEKSETIDKIIAQVISENTEGEVAKVDGQADVFSVTKDGETKFYIAEFTEDGVVKVFEATSERKRGDQKGDSENLATLDGVEGTEGIDYTAVYHEAVAGTPAQEATYEITYGTAAADTVYTGHNFMKNVKPSDYAAGTTFYFVDSYNQKYNITKWNGAWYYSGTVIKVSGNSFGNRTYHIVTPGSTDTKVVKESELKNYTNITSQVKKTDAVAAVPATPAYYTVTYYNSYVEYDYADKIADADNSNVVNKYNSYEEAKAAADANAQNIETQQGVVSEKEQDKINAKSNLEEAKRQKALKEAELAEAEREYNRLKDYYETKKLQVVGLFDYEWETDYQKDLDIAKGRLALAKEGLEAAEANVSFWEGKYSAAEREYKKQVNELKAAVNDWIDAVAAEGKAAAIFAGASINLADAKAKYAAAMAADQYAALLQEDAIAAKKAAKEARDLVKKLKADVAAGSLAEALAALEDAEAKLKTAQEAAAAAAKYAKDARTAYEEARSKARWLAIQEYYNQPAEEETVEELTVVTPAVRRVAAAAAPVVEEVEEAEEEEVVEVVEEEETPLEEEPVVIEEEETPLATMEEQAKMSWWWMLIVLAFGGAGAEIYRRHLVKKNADKLGK